MKVQAWTIILNKSMNKVNPLTIVQQLVIWIESPSNKALLTMPAKMIIISPHSILKKNSWMIQRRDSMKGKGSPAASNKKGTMNQSYSN